MVGASELAEIENEVLKLQHSIDTTQEVLQLNLARSRNRLQTLNLFTSIGALCRMITQHRIVAKGLSLPIHCLRDVDVALQVHFQWALVRSAQVCSV